MDTLKTVVLSALLAAISLLTASGPALADSSLAAHRQWREDVNADGQVDIFDLLALLPALKGSGNGESDVNADGRTDIMDLLALLGSMKSGAYTSAGPASGAWKRVGPGGGGAQYMPTINPHDPDNVLVRCDMTGGYVTRDGGESWTMFNLRSTINDFEFDPSTPATVYATSVGLFRSQDGGEHWELVFPRPEDIEAEHMIGDHAEGWLETFTGLPTGEKDVYFDQVDVDPRDGNHIWLTRSSAFGNIPYTLLVTDDGGLSWRELLELQERAMSMFPGSWWGKNGELLVFTRQACYLVDAEGTIAETRSLPSGCLFVEGGRDSTGAVVFYGLTASKIYRSDDLSVSWQSVTSGSANGGNYGNNVTDNRGARPLAVCENDPNIVYVACQSYQSYEYGTLRSLDGGASWSWSYRAGGSSVLTSNYSSGWMDRVYGPSWRAAPFGLGIGPNNPEVVYATDWGITYHSIDGGEHWEQAYTRRSGDGWESRGLDVTTCYDVVFDPFDDQHVYVCYTDMGSWQSSDGGASWIHADNGIPSQWTNTNYATVFDPEVQGRAWSVWANKHDLPRPKMYRNGFSGQSGGVATSTNAGSSWTPVYGGLPDAAFTHIILDTESPVDARVLYACAFQGGVYRSSDGGKSWTKCADVPGSNRNYWRLWLNGENLFCLVVRVPREVGSGGLYRSADGGGSWEQVALPERVDFPNDLVSDPAEPDRMYLSCWPWTEVGEIEKGTWRTGEKGGGLLRSDDGGATWIRVFAESAHVYAAAIDPANPGRVYINTYDCAAFRSDDYGESWVMLDGYDFKWGQRPVVDPHNEDMLYLTTFGGGVFHGYGGGSPGDEVRLLNFPKKWRWPGVK